MNTYLDGEGGVFMEKSYTKIYTTGATVPLKIRPGHFATNHAHINYYIDVTTLKARKNDSLGLHSARRQAGVPVGILGCNGGGYRQRRIPQPVSDFT